MSKARENRNLIVGLDIGTSKIVAIVAEVIPEGGFEVIGLGSHPRGLKKGVVANIETTVNAIQRALEEAELMADCKIQRCIPELPAVISGVLTRMAWCPLRIRKLRRKTWSASWKRQKQSIFPLISRFCTC